MLAHDWVRTKKPVCNALLPLWPDTELRQAHKKVSGYTVTHSKGLSPCQLTGEGCCWLSAVFRPQNVFSAQLTKEACSVVSGGLRWATSKGTPKSGVNGENRFQSRFTPRFSSCRDSPSAPAYKHWTVKQNQWIASVAHPPWDDWAHSWSFLTS